MQELQANTQVTVPIGPFVDYQDGVTPETGITLGAADEAAIVKHNSTETSISGATWSGTSLPDGWYNLTLTTGHTDTEGMLTVIVQDNDVCLPVRAQFMVLSQAAYASKYGAKDTGYMDVDVTAVSTSTTAANNMETVYDTDFATNYNGTRNAWATNVQDFVGTTGADPFGGYVVAASVTAGVSVTNLTVQASTTLATGTHNPQSGDSYAIVNGAGGISDINTDVEAILADTGTITGADGVTLATAQALYAPAKAGDAMTLAAGAITNASLAGNMETVFETDFGVNYNATRQAWTTNRQDWVGTTGADPFGGYVVAADVTAAVAVDDIQDGAIGAAAVADIFSTTTLTEAYAADGAAGTPAQLMYETLQSLTEFAISGTTITVKKRDGSTTAATFTIDSSTAPTLRYRSG